MGNSPSIVQHALDLLEPLGAVEARSMFGGHGLYTRGVMFGVIVRDEVYLKTDDANRAEFLEAGCAPWIYENPRRRMQTDYYRPPDGAFEDAEAMLPWASSALKAAVRKQALKSAASAGRRSGGERSKGASKKTPGAPVSKRAKSAEGPSRSADSAGRSAKSPSTPAKASARTASRTRRRSPRP